MRVRLLLFSFFGLFTSIVFTQTTEGSGPTSGLVLSSSLVPESSRTVPGPGWSAEVGYFRQFRISKRSSISIEARLRYAKLSDSFSNGGVDFALIEDTIDLYDIDLRYQSLSVSVPIKYRYKHFDNFPLYAMIGVNGNFRIWDDINYTFEKYDYDWRSFDRLDLLEIGSGEAKQEFYNYDLLLAGIGYLTDRLMIEAYFRGGNIGFKDDELVGGIDNVGFAVSLYYGL